MKSATFKSRVDRVRVLFGDDGADVTASYSPSEGYVFIRARAIHDAAWVLRRIKAIFRARNVSVWGSPPRENESADPADVRVEICVLLRKANP